MSNVKFLRGEQSKLNNLTSFVEGAFYLTSDTDRLYFAQSNSELVYLNKYIATVSDQSKLPLLANVNIGDFYYVADVNALVTKSTENAIRWTQVNAPDTDTKVNSLAFETVTKDNNIVVTCTLTQKDIKGDIIEDKVTGTLTISGSDIGAIVAEISLDLAATVENNSATFGLVGSGIAADATGAIIVGGDNVTISDDNGKVKIASKNSTYTLLSEENNTDIILKDDLGDESIVNIKHGDTNNSISVTGANANEIVVSHKDYNYTGTALEDQTPGNAGQFNIISGIELENGHITNVSTSKVILPNMTYSIKNVSADSDGKISVTLADYKGDGEAISSDAQLYYVINGENVYNQADLTEHFYTKDYIDSTLQSANAMTFKGHVGDDSTLTELPTDNVAAGDTYLVTGSSAILVGATIGYKGDLFIASGEEDSETGYINSENLQWIHVPAGDEIDTTYTFGFSAAKNGLVIKDNISGDETILNISGGNAIEVSTNENLVISHANIARQDILPSSEDGQQLGGSSKFTVVTGVSSNAQGHITGVNTETFVIPATDTYSLEKTTGNKVILKDKAGDSTGSIEVKVDKHLTVASAAPTDGSGIEFAIGHNTINVTDNSANPNEVNLAAANNADDVNSFKVITGYDKDECGHLSNVEFTTFKMPYDSTYTQSSRIASEGTNEVNVNSKLVDRVGDSKGELDFILTSDSLNVSTYAAEKDGVTRQYIKTDIEWGSF